jgi:hypothetical protein
MEVHWIQYGRKPVPYNKGTHMEEISKFLYWWTESGGILIVGPSEELMRSHQQVREQAGSVAPDRDPDGAGEAMYKDLLDTTPRITSWFSFGFKVSTPTERRKEIAEALGLEEA